MSLASWWKGVGARRRSAARARTLRDNKIYEEGLERQRKTENAWAKSRDAGHQAVYGKPMEDWERGE